LADQSRHPGWVTTPVIILGLGVLGFLSMIVILLWGSAFGDVFSRTSDRRYAARVTTSGDEPQKLTCNSARWIPVLATPTPRPSASPGLAASPSPTPSVTPLLPPGGAATLTATPLPDRVLLPNDKLLFEPTNEQECAFMQRPETLTWLFIMGVQGAFWGLVLLPLGAAVSRTWSVVRDNQSRKRVLVRLAFQLAIAMLLLAAPFWFSHTAVLLSPWPIADFTVRTALIIPVGILTGLIAIAGIALVYDALDHFFAEAPMRREGGEGGKIPIKSQIERLTTLRSDLQRCVLIFGAMIGLAMLAYGRLREAAVALESTALQLAGVVTTATDAESRAKGLFPGDGVVLFGAYFTVVLVLVVVGVQAKLLSVGNKLVDEQYPLVDDQGNELDKNGLATVLTNRKSLQTALNLELTTKQVFEYGGAILAPFTGSILSIL
jgi:hypothetical protein